MSRLRAETMPADTEPPRPNGLPIAITQSPMRAFSLSPNFTAFSGLSDFTRSTARSILGSLPTTSAFSLRPSVKMTVISLASPMTWLLVMTMPDASMTKPEPSELDRRCWRGLPLVPPCCRSHRRRHSGPLKNSSKKSSKGEPGGSCGDLQRCAAPPLSSLREMLTTASDHLLGEVGEAFRCGTRKRAGSGSSRRARAENRRAGR